MLVNTNEQKGPTQKVEETVDKLEDLAKVAEQETNHKYGRIKKIAAYGLGFLNAGILAANVWLMYDNAQTKDLLAAIHSDNGKITEPTTAYSPIEKAVASAAPITAKPAAKPVAQPVSYQAPRQQYQNQIPVELASQQKLTIDTKAESKQVQEFIVQHTGFWTNQFWDQYISDYADNCQVDIGKAVLGKQELLQYKKGLQADIQSIDLGQGEINFSQRGDKVVATMEVPQIYIAKGYRDSGIKRYVITKNVGGEYKIINEGFTPALK